MTLKHVFAGIVCAAVTVLSTPGATAAQPAATAGVGLAQIAEPVAQADWPTRKAALQLYGEQFHTAADLYAALRKQAKGGRKLTWGTIPDWSGVYARAISSLRYDLDQPSNDFDESKMPELPTAKLTPEARAKYIKQMQDAVSGKEYDAQLSACLPAGVPRWFTEPYLRDFAISPGQTWLMNELANETRRVYTDGRAHPKKEDQYPTFEGDSIGFWVGDKLVVHTNGLTEGNFQRREPEHTADAELVEVWRKIDAATVVADVWVFDPQVLAAPWFTRQSYLKQDNADSSLRIGYYDCVGTPNTRVIKTQDGGTTFEDLNFDKSASGGKRKE